MRKVILITAFILIGLSILFSTSLLALAVKGDLRIDHYLFPLQTFSENTYAKFIPRPDWLTSYLLDLTQRRLLDLALFAGTTYETDAIQALDTTFLKSFEAYYSLDPDSSTQMTPRIEEVLEQIQNLSSILKLESSITKSYDQLTAKLEIYYSLLSQYNTLQAAASAPLSPSIFGSTPVTPTPIVSGSVPALYGSSGLIPFFPGSTGWDHSFFPLLGSHSSLACSSCHQGSSYSGISATCEYCHDAVKPVNHFPLACEYCHTPEAWNSVNFTHTDQLPANCATCHASVKPSSHYNGSCSACHSTLSWLPADFNHQAAGATDCQSCHIQTRPADHYTGQCSSCHSTSAWQPATFNHQAAGATDCQSCHIQTRPADHYTGQCSSCHSTSAWQPATFNHQAAGATDCQSCHIQTRPANHYTGQCSSCHSTSAWQPATFNHQAAGATDCQSCHIQTRPANHYTGQCSSCHSTSAWQPATFNHQAAGATDCQSCHLGVRPANHFTGQCSSCHSTTAWTPANFNHTFPINHEGANGDCAKCHPSNPPAYNCFTCHNRAELDEKHIEDKGIPDYVSRCMDCHPDGQEGDD